MKLKTGDEVTIDPEYECSCGRCYGCIGHDEGVDRIFTITGQEDDGRHIVRDHRSNTCCAVKSEGLIRVTIKNWRQKIDTKI